VSVRVSDEVEVKQGREQGTRGARTEWMTASGSSSMACSGASPLFRDDFLGSAAALVPARVLEGVVDLGGMLCD
jgi:hypothetical protein